LWLIRYFVQAFCGDFANARNIPDFT
jgi:hypothetical protein